ncbi:MAG: Foldase foldase protein PrsA [candidate division WS6 bacterium GW2011_GWC1_33_20]|uniref:Foldase foldase protein PrsA n=1 Tax=candidate division WS6 bacterium GW2011_GWC1_33_20 TaxID=1619089 RepID=A0A0G0CK78_9BACT|nr:MAG: Foldase foldase protein PrsA [candidate division WS6 bacterium GW2011_GWE2_33_157]KKP43847.1 MAG: Foldase foldase protein PrsA [candidate division WS6 bacterium GW2011_GWC1_33_20]KKP44362.1 MAG: Foldase foldase protein PrsA [candidate division WS6 bacterium GW2011_GWF1_33_233]KKP54847.1 MAG: Foldase foldase protein PrsA [candidate division WS6 bacterium GW2011_WS6_33_547]KKP56568.1 MAG: PpiC-type peptidyl-prolyl cis-trans isomerase [candidate division WS6 bacterium GW2011_GWF2_33_92]KK
MAKVKIKKGEPKKAQTKSVIRIKKPNLKINFKNFDFKKIKFVKPDFKKIFKNKVARIVAMILVVLVAFVLIDLFVQYLNNGYSIAVVDGSRISKNEYHKRLESLYGQTVASQLIDEELIKQEAKKTGITVTEEDIQVRLDEIIASIGGEETYQQALELNNITENELKDQIRLDLITQQIIEPTLEYTEDDVKAFFEQYSATIFPNETAALEEGEKLDYELYKVQVKDVYIQQEVENQKYTWLEGLYSKYRIQDNSTTKPKYGVLNATITIIKNIVGEANSNDTTTTTE